MPRSRLVASRLSIASIPLAALAVCSACTTTAAPTGVDSGGGGGGDGGVDAHATSDAFAGTDAFTGADAFTEIDAFAGTDAFAEADAFAPPDAFVPPDAYVPPSIPNPGDLVITEIMAAPFGYADDSLAEWVEIHNPSTTVTYELAGCVFSDKPADDDYTIGHSLLVPPGGNVVLSSATFAVATHGFVSDDVYGATGTGLSGTSDAPTLKCGGMIIDTVAYSAANGFPVPDSMEGHTLSLDPGSTDATANDSGAHWCFSTTSFFTAAGGDDFGTPRAPNGACP